MGCDKTRYDLMLGRDTSVKIKYILLICNEHVMFIFVAVTSRFDDYCHVTTAGSGWPVLSCDSDSIIIIIYCI